MSKLWLKSSRSVSERQGLESKMRKALVIILLPLILCGCVYSHTWHHVDTDNNRCYRLVDDGGNWYFETEMSLEYERHLFTEKSGFGYYCEMNMLEALVQFPCVLLTELPFRWLWEKDYVWRVPVQYDKALKVKNDRWTGRREVLAWEKHGVANVVCATVKNLNEDTGDAEISIAHYRGRTKIREVVLEPVVWYSSHHLQTFDGRHVYIWNQFDRASYLYGYFRCGLDARTSWCPILQELDLETGIVRRLVWTEYNKLHHSDEVVVERRK